MTLIMFKENTFQNKVALVTGGRSGIGYQIAKDMLCMGAKVIISSRKEPLLLKAQEELSAFGEVSAKACDIRKEEAFRPWPNSSKKSTNA